MEKNLVQTEVLITKSSEEDLAMNIKLNPIEKCVLDSCVQSVINETGGEFGYTVDVKVDGLTKNQIKGYLSQLTQKKLITICDDEFGQMFINESAKEFIAEETFSQLEF
jgi:hypothetical protein